MCVVRRGALAERLRAIELAARELFDAMDFSFLFDPERRLFSIGLRVGDAMLDPSYYDLLASEARLTSFVAIAKGDVPATHWFRLGRALTPVGNGAVLLSWSGSMFEYLMPSLVMYTPRNSLLDQTCRLAVERQIAYGNERATPWEYPSPRSTYAIALIPISTARSVCRALGSNAAWRKIS
jgi:cyclic beta-1,2-glucan synthetase